MDTREGERAHCEPYGTRTDNRVGGLVAEHARSYCRAGGVLRCEGEKGFREVSRKAEGRDCHLPGTGEPFAAEAGRSPRADESADAAASAANWGSAARGSVRSFSEGGKRADRILETGRRFGGFARFEQAARTPEHDGCKPRSLRHWADPNGVPYRRGLPHDFQDAAAASAGAGGDGNDEHHRRAVDGGVQHRVGDSRVGKAGRGGDYRGAPRFLGPGYRLDRQWNGLNGGSGSSARAGQAKPETQADDPVCAVFGRRARALRLTGVCEGAQGRPG